MQRVLPPTLVLVLVAVMAAVSVLMPLAGPWPWVVRLAGVVLMAVGLVINVRGSSQFARVGTNIKPFEDPDVLVATGLFGFTRNPMYLGFAMLLAGLALLLGAVSAWIGPALFWLAADRWYIPFEERRMSNRFGRRYEAYRSVVPRWIGRAG